MSTAQPLLLVSNGMILSLALAFLLIVLWYDLKRTVNQFFALFLLLVVIWNGGDLIYSAGTVIDLPQGVQRIAFAVSQVGFVSASIALYTLMIVLVGIQPRRFRWVALAGLLVATAFNSLSFIWVGASSVPQVQPVPTLFYAIFGSATVFLVWRYRRKVRSVGLTVGVLFFVAGQALTFLNPELSLTTLATTISAMGALAISFAIAQLEIVRPLTNRDSQFESMYEISLAITSRIAADSVLDEIVVRRAVEWLEADAAAIFLQRSGMFELAVPYNLPPDVRGMRAVSGRGMVGRAVQQRQAVFVQHFGSDWRHEIEFDFAADTFGSVICAPMVYDDNVIGVLMVIAGRQGRLFSLEDVRLLELLCSQAAVALSNSQLFTIQRQLTTQVANAHDQLKTVLESTENPVLAVDRDLRLIFVNPAAEKLLELPPNAEGLPIVDLVPSASLPPSYLQMMRCLHQEKDYVYEVAHAGRVYFCHIATLGEARVVGWVAVLNDVTQLKELDRLKSEMVRMTSHDLKNPLQAALANLDLLRDDLADISGVEHAEVVQSIDNIERQLNRMGRIIGGILDLERVRSAAMPLEPCAPTSAVNAVIDEMQAQAQARNITLRVDVADATPDFWGNPPYFERALVNLVENAIKFTPEGGQVTVRAYPQASQVVFEVQDTGIGIPQEVQAHIFDRFFRANQPGAEHVSGTGLGLNLVKTVIDNHGGRIHVKSHLDAGTTFSIFLNAVTEQQVALHP